MTVIAAAAMSFGLFADGLDNGWKASEKTATDWNADELWTGDGLEAGATFVEGQYLQIKSPSAAVTRKIVADGTFSVTSNVFFDVDLDLLGQALDEVPAVAEGTKLALFVLDPAEITTGLKVAPAAGLYAIAGGENGGQVLYRLNAALDELTNGVNKITVKGYDNVLKGDTANAGFIVYTRGDTTGDATACAIDAAYTVNQDGTWTDLNYNSNTYLKDKTIPKLSMADKRICVLLNLVGGVDGQDFAGLDFLGNANVAAVTMNEEGFSYIPADANDMIITLGTGITGVADPEGIWDADTGVVTGLGTITLSAEGKDIFKFAGEVDPTVASIAGDVLTISTLAPGEAFNVIATKSVATVTIDDVTTKYDNFADAIKAANKATAATLALAGDVSEALTFGGKNITLDLAGKAVTAKITNTGVLTIIDTVTGGSVTATPTAVESGTDGSLTVNAGIFNGAVVVAWEEEEPEDALLNINGGAFSVKPEGKYVVIPEDKEFAYENNYWVLKDVQQDIDIKDAVITLAADSIEFGEYAPAITSVVVNETTLTEGDDYTVTCDYEKGVSGVGTYTYTLTAVKDSGYTGTATKDFTVEKATVTITTAPTASAEIEKGAKLSTISLVGGSATVAGEFAWTDGDTEVNATGLFSATFTPTDATNYKTATCEVMVTVKEEAKPVVPGQDVPIPSGMSADEYADEINDPITGPALKEKLLVAPNDAEVETTAAYRELFQAVATGDKVTFELTEAAVETLTEAAETAAAAALAADEDGVSIEEPIAGLYYGLKNADALDEMAVTQKVLSDGSTISWDIDKTNAAGFWQVIVGAKDSDIPEPVKE